MIRGHYDLVTLFYRLLWGPHIHHGLWQGDESASNAQLHLTNKLADLAKISGGERVLDIGCGMGGSAIHLAKHRDCHVTGVTISPVQRWWAAAASQWHGVKKQTTFRRVDAEAVEFAAASADVVWSIECTEHLFDKPQFFQRAANWLKPGGCMAICAWLAGRNAEDADHRRQVYRVCDGFFCPSLGSAADYRAWMTAAGLQIELEQDWTSRVSRTWEICLGRVRRYGMRPLARLLDRDAVLFLDHFEAILEAYRTGAMEYGCFIARKPE
jgi:tocopherol O-methyltransferase